MAFHKIYPPGYSYAQLLTSAQMNDLQDQFVDALDAIGGGSYDMGDNTITLTGNSGTSLVELSTDIIRLYPQDSVDLNGAMFVTTGGSITINSGTTFTASSGSSIEFNSTPNFNLGFSVTAGTAEFNTDVSLLSTLTPGPFGQVLKRISTGSNADVTISVNTADIVHVPQGVLSGDHTYTLNDTGAVDGSMIRVSNEDTTHKLTISANAGGLSLTNIYYTSGAVAFVDLVFLSNDWHVSMVGLIP